MEIDLRYSNIFLKIIHKIIQMSRIIRAVDLKEFHLKLNF
jgi:hypothetical protein